jgi:hypothetical protein
MVRLQIPYGKNIFLKAKKNRQKRIVSAKTFKEEHGYLFSGNELGNNFCSPITDAPGGRPSKSWTLEGDVVDKFSKAFPPAFTRAISWLTRIRFFIPEKRYPCSPNIVDLRQSFDRC